MRKYIKMQIIKHALLYYIQRPKITTEQLKQEQEVLKQVVQEVKNLKMAYNIEQKTYIIKHASGRIFHVEATGEKQARRKAFEDYKLLKKNSNYYKFINNIDIKEMEEE